MLVPNQTYDIIDFMRQTLDVGQFIMTFDSPIKWWSYDKDDHKMDCIERKCRIVSNDKEMLDYLKMTLIKGDGGFKERSISNFKWKLINFNKENNICTISLDDYDLPEHIINIICHCGGSFNKDLIDLMTSYMHQFG